MGISKQVLRQKVRDLRGRYVQYPRCELCQRMLRPGNYYSHEKCGLWGLGVELCEADAAALSLLSDEQGLRILQEACREQNS